MGRKKTFDTRLTLQKTLMVFWEKGFKSTSLEDISRATGLKKPSLYNTFGNKDELFIESLKLYKELMQQRLDSYPKGIDFIHYFFTALFKEEKEGTLPNGCLIMNSAVEFSKYPIDDEKKKLTNLSWNMLQDYFKEAIFEARQQSAIKPDINPEEFSIWLMTQVYSVRGFARMAEFSYCEEVIKHVTSELNHISLNK